MVRTGRLVYHPVAAYHRQRRERGGTGGDRGDRRLADAVRAELVGAGNAARAR